MKAYLKKWRNTILLFFALGLLAFFILKFVVNYFIPLIPFTQEHTVGIVGAYTVDTLPPVVLSKVSRGLTYVASDYTVKPDLAKSWEIKNDGKTYVFHLKNNVYFSDGTKFSSDEITYNFSNVDISKPNKDTIIFNLKSSYSPFLVTVSRPIFKDGFVGIGSYRVRSLNLNGSFVQSIELVSTQGGKEILYQFYATEDAVKTAYMLGDIDEINELSGTNFQNKDMLTFKGVSSFKSTNYTNLVTLFYDTNDKDLSDKKLREALAYTMPDKFIQGERNYGPFPPTSWVNNYGLTTYNQDFEHAKSLLDSSATATNTSTLTFQLQTLPQYKDLADQIKDLWQKIGIKTNIKVVDAFPTDFQIFLGDFNVSKDPDQYTLWHSSQENNITNYKNLRIDKLLEDGRQTVDMSQRGKIYSDFQKYLLDDPPATFLYFPYQYNLKRI